VLIFLLSIALVLGAVGVFIGNVAVSEQGELGFGFQQMIHARVPWALIAPALAGAGLGVYSLVRAPRWYKWPIVPVQVLLAGLLTVYFTTLSSLPNHRLALAVGDPFPSYSLVDQDGRLHTFDSSFEPSESSSESSDGGRPALYVFYRGDW